MSRATFTVAYRVLLQLRGGPRLIGITLVMPLVLLALVREDFNRIEPSSTLVQTSMLAILPVVLTFLISSITTVRERTTGTLEQLMSSPVRRADVIFGYVFGYSALAGGLAAGTSLFSIYVLDAQITGNPLAVMLVGLVAGLFGLSLGLLASTVSHNESESAQMLHIFLTWQIFFSGLFSPRENMAAWMSSISDWVPLTWSVEAMKEVASGNVGERYWLSVGIVFAVTCACILLATTRMRRQNP